LVSEGSTPQQEITDQHSVDAPDPARSNLSSRARARVDHTNGPDQPPVVCRDDVRPKEVAVWSTSRSSSRIETPPVYWRLDSGFPTLTTVSFGQSFRERRARPATRPNLGLRIWMAGWVDALAGSKPAVLDPSCPRDTPQRPPAQGSSTSNSIENATPATIDTQIKAVQNAVLTILFSPTPRHISNAQ
jgi:hypothetical protein